MPPSQSGPLATTTPEPIHPRERNGPRPWPQVITQTITSTLPAETCREATTETTKLAFASGLGDLECVTPLETVVISSSTTYYQPLCNKVVGGRYEVIAGFSTSDFGFKWVTTGISNSRDCLGACTTTTGTVINGGTTSIATIPCLYANWSTWARSSSSTPVYTKYTNTDCVLAYGSVAYIHWYDPNWLFHGNIDGDWAYSTAYTAYMAVAPATATATMVSVQDAMAERLCHWLLI